MSLITNLPESPAAIGLVILGLLLCLFWWNRTGRVLTETNEKSAADQNRRRAPRYRVAWPVQASSMTMVTNGVTHNVSLEGCRIRTEQELQLGESIRVRLFPPEEKNAISVDMAIVRWALGCDIGVEFLSLSVSDRHQLGKALLASGRDDSFTRQRS